MCWGWSLSIAASTVLALMPVEHLQLPIFNLWDKAQHALAFAMLTGWALLLWPQSVARVIMGMLAYGALLEWAQAMTGWRYPELTDWLADALGVLTAWAIFRAWADEKPSNP